LVLSEEPSGLGQAFKTLFLTALNAVRLYAPTDGCLSFPSLAMFSLLATCHPSWSPPAGLREALAATAAALQAADTRQSRMQWRTWRRAEGGGDDGRMEFGEGPRGAEVRDAFRILCRGFIVLHGDDADMVARYADVMVRRGGLPLYALPRPDPLQETRLGKGYLLAAIETSVHVHLPMYLQACLTHPPRCESTCQKDNHLRNLEFFVEQALFNIREQKEMKARGGFIEAMDVERIVGYMDEAHFASGRDLAEARALEDDSALTPSNPEGFTGEEECHLASERCRELRRTLEALQFFVLNGPGATVARAGPAQYLPAPGPEVLGPQGLEQHARLEGFLSLFGATVETCLPGQLEGQDRCRVTCANLDSPSSPLVVQRADGRGASQGKRNYDPYISLTDPETMAAAEAAYCAAFRGIPVSLPLPPLGCRWRCSSPASLLVERASGGSLSFIVAGIQVPVFDAGQLLEPCRPPAVLHSLGGDIAALRRALYLEPFEPQVLVLHRLRELGAELRHSGEPHALSAPDWLAEAFKSPIHTSIWQEAYARLLLEEQCEGDPCLTLPPAHPYQGTLLRAVLVLQFLYPEVLEPTRSELAFRISRGSERTSRLHAHLVQALRALAFREEPPQVPQAPPRLQAGVVTEMFPYQVEAVKRLVDGRNAGLHGSLDASSLGSGKTLVTLRFCLALAEAHGGGRFLVLVGSASLMDGWRQQIVEHTEGVELQLQQENGVLRTMRRDVSAGNKRKARELEDEDAGTVNIVVSTYSRAARHPFFCTWLLVVADECLALQNTESLQAGAAWRLVTRSLYGGHFISGTMFRRHYSDLLDMLKMLHSSLPLQEEFVQAYFRVHLISYLCEQRSWETRLVPMEIPSAVRSQYLEVLDECRGRDAQNYAKVLARMRKVLSDALRDGRQLAERIWETVRELRTAGRRPLVFANTEHEAEALVRHISCARRFRRDRHPAHCPGCDVCRGFNKFAIGAERCPPVEGSDTGETLLVFTVGSDAAGLNLQSYGDALVLRPVQMDQLVQMMGRLDRPGQSSECLCRAIIYMRRTHEEAEVAHLEKHAAFWSLHIKPLARLIVLATVGADAGDGEAVGDRYRQILAGTKQGAATPSGVRTGCTKEATASLPVVQRREFLARAAQHVGAPLGEPAPARVKVEQAERAAVAAPAFARLRTSASVARNEARFDVEAVGCGQFAFSLGSSPRGAIDLDEPAGSEPAVPIRMTRESVQLGLGYLLKRDPRFRHVVQLIGPPTNLIELLERKRPDPFTTLVQTICHQQLSMRVCQAMFERLLGLCGDPENKLLDPARVVAEHADKVREVAKLSYRKIGYIQQIAERFVKGALNEEVFESAPDDELRRRMTLLPGIGEWTLEMFLIFQLHRHGAIPYGDVALQGAMKLVYDIPPHPGIAAKNEVTWMPTKAQMEQHTRLWGPFGSIASLYMLRVADNERAAVFLPE